MFTFGRDHEKNCSVNYVHDPAQVSAIQHVIDAVHDFLEGSRTSSDVELIIATAFTTGGSGVWEQTGSWLVKLGGERPEFTKLWSDFATHKSAKIRFRAAAFVCNLPDAIVQQLVPKLLADRSAKVRSKMAGDLWVKPRQRTKQLLIDRLAIETNVKVRGALTFAVEAASKHGG